MKIGKYEIDRQIGAGGMGVVYRATDPDLRRTVALKVLTQAAAADPASRERFMREARAASALDHPNIATVYEIGEADGALFIAMAFVEGETLADLIEKGPLPIADVESLLRQLLEAIDAAHRANIVHRDLKPANVLLTADGRLKVVDFGLAKLRAAGRPTEESLTATGMVVGTASHMSPEQARGLRVDSRSDLWAVGVIAYEMLTGVHPFSAPTPLATLARITTRAAEPVENVRSEIPGHLRQLVRVLLEKDPQRRIPSASAALGYLRPHSDDSTAVLPAASHPGRFRASRRWLAIGGGVALVAALLAGLFQSRAAPELGAVSSLVVLPCRVFGSESHAFLADAIPSTLTTLLGQAGSLTIRHPPSSLEVSPDSVDLQRIARTFEVDACLTCTVTADATRLLLSLQLVDPQDGRLVWSRAIEGSRDGYLDLVAESAHEVLAALDPGAVVPEVPERASASRAELAMRLGRYHLSRYNNVENDQDFDLAIEAFDEALELEPSLAEAAAQIGLLHFWRAADTLDPTGLARGEEWARRALAIDRRCGRAWAVLSGLERVSPEPRADRILEYALRAVSFTPEDELALYVLHMQLETVDARLAVRAIRQATRVDPLYAWGYLGESLRFMTLGDIDAALARLEAALEIEPEHVEGRAWKAYMLVAAGDLEAARSIVAHLEAEGESVSWRLDLLHLALRLGEGTGPLDEALRQNVLELQTRCDPGVCGPEWTVYVSPLLLRRGEVDFVVGTLETAWEEAGRLPPIDWLTENPDVEPLRSHAGYAELLAHSRVRAEAAFQVLETARAEGYLPPFLEDALAETGRKLGVAGEDGS